MQSIYDGVYAEKAYKVKWNPHIVPEIEIFMAGLGVPVTYTNDNYPYTTLNEIQMQRFMDWSIHRFKLESIELT